MENRNNFVLRKLRYALNLKEKDIKDIFSLDNYDIDENTITQYMEREDAPLFREMRDDVLESFLNGLITKRRGKKEDTAYEKKRTKPRKVLMPESSKNRGFN